MPQKMKISTVFLIVLLAMRLAAQVAGAVLSFPDMLFIAVYGTVAAVYAAALAGVLRKMKWGSALALIIAVADILFASVAGGVEGIGAVVVDLFLLCLAYREYAEFATKKKSVLNPLNWFR